MRRQLTDGERIVLSLIRSGESAHRSLIRGTASGHAVGNHIQQQLDFTGAVNHINSLRSVESTRQAGIRTDASLQRSASTIFLNSPLFLEEAQEMQSQQPTRFTTKRR